MKLQETPAALPAHSSHHASTSGLGTTLLASSSNSWVIDSWHFPICQIHNPYLLANPNYHKLLLFLLQMVVSLLLGDMARPIRPPHSSYLKSFMFLISLSTSYQSAPSPKHYFAPSHSLLTIAPFKICIWGRGLVWGMRLDMEFMSLSLIIF